MAALQGKPRLIKSYETDTRRDADELYIQNAAFSYDNATGRAGVHFRRQAG
jgi:hypothetical protein